MNGGGLVAALAGLALGGGFLLWKKKQATAGAGSSSQCESLCMKAHAASGVAGDLSTTTAAGKAQALQACSLACSAAQSEAIKTGATILGKLQVGLRGFVTGTGDRTTTSVASCPEGSELSILNREIVDHRADDEGGVGNQGSYCRDKATGQILGTVDAAGFHPIASGGAFTAPTPPPPSKPITSAPVPSLSLAGIIGR